MTKNKKIAIVGIGSVATSSYLPYLSERKDVSLLYYDCNYERAKTATSKFGGKACQSIQELMGNEPDAVLVLTREMHRYDVTLEVIQFKPQRLFFEKPLVAMNGQSFVDEDDFNKAKKMIDLAKECGAKVGMNFNYRFFDQTIKARSILSNRGFGSLINVTGLTHYACWSHCIDLIYFLGGPIATVSALKSEKIYSGGDVTAPDKICSFLSQSGFSGQLIATAGIHFGFDLFSMEFNFEGGRIRMHCLDGDLEVIDYQEKQLAIYQIPRDKSRWNQYGQSFVKSINAYLESIDQNLDAPVDAINGLNQLQFEAGVFRSIQQNRPIHLMSEFPI